MAQDLTVSFWPGRPSSLSALEFYRRLLGEYGSAQGGRTRFWWLYVYHRSYPKDWGADSKDPCRPVRQRFEHGKSADEIAQILEDFQGPEYCWVTDGSYRCLKWSNESQAVEEGWGQVSFSYNGPQFLGDGHHHFTQGAFKLSFDNVRHFTGSTIELPPGVTPRQLRFISNAQTLFGIFRHLVSRLPIEHAAAWVMAEVCPVNFHMVYHDRISAYENDVRKILQLHERGGGYFYEDVRSYSPGSYKLIAYDIGDTYSSVSDVGRSEGEVAELIERLDGFSERLGIPDPGTRLLTDDEILETLVECPGIEVGEAGPGIYMIHPGTPFEFLTEPYFRLMERMIGKKGRVLPTVH